MSSRQGLLGQIDAIGAEAFHILLVEDDELTLKVTEGLLRHCDYQGVVFGQAETRTTLAFIDCLCIPVAVTLARNGRQALEALQSPQGEHINLILTDVLMPEVCTDHFASPPSLLQVCKSQLDLYFADLGGGSALLFGQRFQGQVSTVPVYNMQ